MHLRRRMNADQNRIFRPDPKPAPKAKKPRARLRAVGKKPRVRKAAKRLGLRRTADTLWSKLIKVRDGRCRRCGRTDRALEAAHILPRRVLTTRWDPRNGVALCAIECHRWMDNPTSSLERITFIDDLIGRDEHLALIERGRRLWDRDYRATITALRLAVAGLEKAA